MFVMNKNVNHNGKDYARGQELKHGDPIEMFVKAGHADEIKGVAKQEEQPVEPVKPVKPKKHAKE